MKKLGILGGMGPFATAYFFRSLVEMTKAQKDWDHIHTVIDSNTAIPSRTRAVLYGEKSPVQGMIDSINQLASIGCELAAVPCNSAHFFYGDVSRKISIPWINMLEVVSRELNAYEKVIVLGGYITVNKKTYDPYLDNTVYLNDEANRMVLELIEAVKINADYRKIKTKLIEEIQRFSGPNVCVLLACTELPIAFQENQLGSVRIENGNNLYIRELIKLCGGEVL